MSRYSSTPITKTKEIPQRRYLNIKYPDISLDSTDIYVSTTRGDRYDLLARDYYGDSSLWWIISRANPTQSKDSLSPQLGSQIRIPNQNRIPTILSQYDNLNENI